MIITNQPTQPIIDKEIKEIEKDKRLKSQSSSTSSKPIFNKQDLTDQKLSLIEQKLGELTNKLLASLKAGESGPNTPKALQVAPNLASDIKDLIKQLDGNEKLAPFKEALKEFIKPIETIKASNVASSIQNSGVMLEAKIAQALESESLPTKIKELLSQMKNVSSPALKESFLTLPNDSDANKSIEDLAKLLNSQKLSANESLKNSPHKALLNAAKDMENAIKFLDKLSNLSKNTDTKAAAKILAKVETLLENASKAANSYNLNSQSLSTAKNIREQLNTNIAELKSAINMLKKGDANFKNELAATKNQANQNQAANASLNSALKLNQPNQANQANQPNQINTPNGANQGSGIRLNIQTANVVNQANSASNQANQANNASAPNQASNAEQNSPNSFFANQSKTLEEFKSLSLAQFKDAISQNVNSQNLQGKMGAIAKNLGSLLDSISPDSTKAKHTLDEIKTLQSATKAAKSQINSIGKNDSEQALKSLQNDLKSVLLNLKESSASQGSQNVNQAVNRLLTQIEIHQLASYSQNTLQTYLPYTWDELDSSHVSFKRGNKNKFYARIELNFVKFGEVSVVLGLSENKFLDISIQTSKAEFKDMILGETKSLKRALNEQGLIVNNFFLSLKNTQNAYEQIKEIDLGYNVKA